MNLFLLVLLLYFSFFFPYFFFVAQKSRIPSEWVCLMEEAGISLLDLTDEDTAFILKTIVIILSAAQEAKNSTTDTYEQPQQQHIELQSGSVGSSALSPSVSSSSLSTYADSPSQQYSTPSYYDTPSAQAEEKERRVGYVEEDKEDSEDEQAEEEEDRQQQPLSQSRALLKSSSSQETIPASDSTREEDISALPYASISFGGSNDQLLVSRGPSQRAPPRHLPPITSPSRISDTPAPPLRSVSPPPLVPVSTSLSASSSTTTTTTTTSPSSQPLPNLLALQRPTSPLAPLRVTTQVPTRLCDVCVRLVVCFQCGHVHRPDWFLLLFLFLLFFCTTETSNTRHRQGPRH